MLLKSIWKAEQKGIKGLFLRNKYRHILLISLLQMRVYI